MTVNKREFCRRRDEVLKLLDEYAGEEIVKDEHPLHLAVQRLEAVCNPVMDKLGWSQNRLFAEANPWWFSLLDTSRGNTNARAAFQRKHGIKSMEWRYLVKNLKRVIKTWKGSHLKELQEAVERRLENRLALKADRVSP